MSLPVRQRGRGCLTGGLLALILWLGSPAFLLAQNSGVVVISEIMYHPPGGGQELEFVELHNAASEPLDLSGWFFSRGISFVFPEGIWLRGGETLVVCADEAAVRREYGIENTIGNWQSCSGSGGEGCALDNGGEMIELVEASRVRATAVEYNDRGFWPVGADGAGHSLEIRSVHAKQEAPESWVLSALPGGSPGQLNPPESGARGPVINEALLQTEGTRWVELFNLGGVEADVSGLYLSDDRDRLRKFQIPAGTVLPARGWLSFTESELGFDFASRFAVEESPKIFLALSDRAGFVVDAYNFRPEALEKSEARYPDGDRDFSDRAEPTRAAANRVEVEEEIVINEVHYHPILDHHRAEFVELHNRGIDRAIDLSGWRLTKGLNFDFPPGTSIAAGGYLVVARDPEYLREVHGLPDTQVLGPDTTSPEAIADFGSLGDDGERVVLRDENGNRVDGFHYQDGGAWPTWADGHGSSMELIDPFQDNAVAQAWDASDDSDKAEVQEIRYSGFHRTGAGELHLVTTSRGMVVIDDLRVSQFVKALDPERSEIFIDEPDEWRIFKGKEEPSEPREAWRQVDFNDDSWFLGRAPIGYGEGDESTVLDDMPGNYITFYCRKEFSIDDPAGVENLALLVEIDDGFIAYLNGSEIVNFNVSGDAFDAKASEGRERFRQAFSFQEHAGLLRAGKNVLAIQVHNISTTSNDARFAAALGDGFFTDIDGASVVPGGSFEGPLTEGTGAGEWLIEGNHLRSGLTREAISGSQSLKLIASGKGNNKVNRLEVQMTGVKRDEEYNIAFKSRWQIGTPTLLTHGHNTAGNNSSIDFGGSHRLQIPENLGSPGRENSVTRRLRERSGGVNLGPVMDEPSHEPAVPAADQPVRLRLRVQDSNGVSDVRVRWSLNSPLRPGDAGLEEVVLSGPDLDGFYEVELPGQELETAVVYSFVATDRLGQLSRFPSDILQRSHPMVTNREDVGVGDQRYLIYRHEDPVDTSYPVYRFWMHALNELAMESGMRRLLSNERVEGTFVFGDRDLYYGSGIRFSGSPWARGNWTEGSTSYRVKMPKDRPLHGAIKKFNMEDHQGGGARAVQEPTSHYMLRHLQGSIQVPYQFLWVNHMKVNDRSNRLHDHYQAPDLQYVQRWFPGDDDGLLFEVDDRFEISDEGERSGATDARLLYPPQGANARPPDDPYQYRFYFNPRIDEDEDEWGELIELARLMDPGHTSDEEFMERVFDEVDVEEFLRVWAIRLNTDDWDSYGARRGKNAYLYRSSVEGRWKLFAWDMENTYVNSNAFPVPKITSNYQVGDFREVWRLINQPLIKRRYYSLLTEMVDKPFDPEFLAPFAEEIDAAGRLNIARLTEDGYVGRRRRHILLRLEGAVLPEFGMSITSNDGQPITTLSRSLALEGLAPLDVQTIVMSVAGSAAIPVDFAPDDALGWATRVELPDRGGVFTVDFFGFDARGDIVDSVSIQITSIQGVAFLRGDVDLSGRLNLADPLGVLNFVFRGKDLPCEDAADADDSGGINLGDALHLLEHIFLRGSAPAAPYPVPGIDPSDDDPFGCETGLVF